MNKIYPQEISGRYRNLKNISNFILLAIYFGCSWIRWDRGEDNPSQALIIDLPSRIGYFFGIQIWHDEIYYIMMILILGAVGLFFFTSLFGRVWCGYTCPQTVFTDIFIKIERFWQGDRNARIRLDLSESDPSRLFKKVATHASQLLLSFIFAFGWVCYFYDAPNLLIDLLHLSVTKNASLWLVSLTGSTYLFAAHLREKVCIYMCPYGRFQAAMCDKSTQVVTYHQDIGEPRGKGEGAGNCIDCNRCVNVCPTGVDIRDGLQIACIGCGLCIDACDDVMDKINKPRGLISYDSQIKHSKRHSYLRKKILLFLPIFIVICSAIAYSLFNKEDMEVSIFGTRGALATIMPDGNIRNTYNISIVNKSLHKRCIFVKHSAEDIFDITLQYSGHKADCIEILPKQNIELKLFVFAKQAIKNQSMQLMFLDSNGEAITSKEIKFTTRK